MGFRVRLRMRESDDREALMPAHLRGLSRRPPLAEEPSLAGKRLLFIGGLHRSGTSVLHRILCDHADVSGFQGTGFPQDEGQFLQSVYPPAYRFGGPGRFAFAAEAHLTEDSHLVSTANRITLLKEWGSYHDLGRSVLVEKSPPNLLKARFLQALYPEASFLFVVRHPIPVTLATQKWTDAAPEALLEHWFTAHEVWLGDLPRLERALVVRYEDLVNAPDTWLGRIGDFIGLEGLSAAARETLDDHNERYFSAWQAAPDSRSVADRLIEPGRQEWLADLGYDLAAPFVTPRGGSRVPVLPA
jgi:hypothetical protein